MPPPGAVRAFGPGRVNLIGEHTDYNHGLCLPFAIDAGVVVEGHPRAGNRVNAAALDLDERDSFELERPGSARGWPAFVRGTVAELRRAGHRLVGADLTISGDVPRGAGLSSSAALEAALTLALLALSGDGEPDRRELARICARVENEWVGAETGLMDQLAAFFGRARHAVLLDMRTLEVAPVALDLDGWQLVAVDSGAPHANAISGYNKRRAECREACRILGVDSLRDLDLAAITSLPAPLDRRTRHVIEENARVLDAITALSDGDLPELGNLLDASHASLRDLYEVSVPAVEHTVERVKAVGAAGARLVGGGFGGAVLALFPPHATPPADALEVRPAPGARLLP